MAGAGSRPPEGAKEERLAAYLARKLGEEIETPSELRRLVDDACEMVATRLPGERRVRVRTPGGAGAARTVIEVLAADSPFLVDTFRLNLRRLGLRERRFLHRLLAIERDRDGSIARLGEEACDVREAFLHAEVPFVARAEMRREIEAELEQVFEDVGHAVTDHGRMVRMIRKHARDIELAASRVKEPNASSELVRFLSWLADENYIFLGYRWYDVSRLHARWRVCAQAPSGLGVMRDARGSRFREPLHGDEIPRLVRRRLDQDHLLFFDKSRSTSRIHRDGRLDCISVKVIGEGGEVRGFGRFIGLLTHKAIKTRVSEIPLLGARRDLVLRSIDGEPGSHTYKAAIEIFDSLPPEFLLTFDQHEVNQVVTRALHASEHACVEAAVVTDPLDRSFFASAIVPRGSYDEELRHDLNALLVEICRANYVEHRTSFVDEEMALIHCFWTSEGDLDRELLSRVEREIRERIAPWQDRFESALLGAVAERDAYRLAAEYGELLPADYRAATGAQEACADVERLERLRSGHSRVELEALPAGGSRGQAARLKIYLRERPYLTDLVPVLDNCGLRVIDATSTQLEGLAPDPLWIVTCRLDGEDELAAICPGRVLDAVRAVLLGLVESGPLNRLVQAAELGWREVDLIRAYLGYAHQLRAAPQVRFAAQTLVHYPQATRALIELFRARFDPELAAERADRENRARGALRAAREPIPTSDDDRVFGLFEQLIGATVRTSFFAPFLPGAEQGLEHAIVLKLQPQQLAWGPLPRPHAEIFVHSADMSGVHLRAGPIARGGIRWSDRVQDFRTEVLGLVKTQVVKNGLIVPVGAKGGFVLRHRPAQREMARAEADRQYARFVRSLLSVTDDLREGRAVSPERVVCHDGPDPYLVVAADKGTAHLSDVANQVAEQRGYWLGDAFASGGSEGYDHKVAGITARGTWVCVRRQFLELGIDIEREPFSAAGIGDMSGDVFGNGLLLARPAKLVAAFNDRHVFIDPDPDPEIAYRERVRLFELERSSWGDYERGKISRGGGVYSRDAKAIHLSPEARSVLALESETLSGEELVRAILRAPVDLLWNGGIGTYVKSSAESHADVSDRANDAVRIDACQLRARVVAEGGNLGLTQLARVEFALAGGRIHTDAIDNSGGVDLSDREVNLKVVLGSRCARGEMTREERNGLLRECASHVETAVLGNSAAQSRCISLDGLRGERDARRISLAAEFLRRHAGLDLDLECLPDVEALRTRLQAGQGYVRPELAVLLGYTKMLAKRELIASPVLDHGSFEPLLSSYFPSPLRERYSAEILGHPLRREITATCLSNRAIGGGGVTLIPELVGALGVSVGEVVAAYYTVDRLLEADRLRNRIRSQPVSESARLRAELRLEEAIRCAARNHLALEGRPCLGPEQFAQGTAQMRSLRELVAHAEGAERSAIERRAERLAESGIDRELALEIEELPSVARALGVLALGEPLSRVLELHTRVGEETRCFWLLDRLSEFGGRGGWERIAAESLALEVLSAQRAITAKLVRLDAAAEDLSTFLATNHAALTRIEDAVRRIESEGAGGLAPLTVIAHRIRRLAA